MSAPPACAVYLGIKTAKLETYYRVARIEGGYSLTRVHEKTDEKLVYHVRRLAGRWSCDCADATMRHNAACKHVKSLRAMIEAGILEEIG